MALESGTKISDLVASNPTGSDQRSQGDDHIRLIKSILKNDAAALSAANIFTANQTIQSTDDGAGSDPELDLDRDSASPAANDVIGLVRYSGRDNLGNKTTYAAAKGFILTPTDGAEDGYWAVNTIRSGATVDRLLVGAGVWLSGATGGDQGTGTLNAQNFYVNGTQLNYEQGTFTPAIAGTTTAGSGTYSIQTGRYQRVGRLCLFALRLSWSAHSGSGNMNISGLPFLCVSNAWHPVSFRHNNIALTAGNVMQGGVFSGNTTVSLEQIPTGGGASGAVPLDTSGDLMVTGTYEIA